MKRVQKSYQHLIAFVGKLLRGQQQSDEQTSVWKFLGLRNQQELERFETCLHSYEVPRNTTYYNIGVGVYQGEAVAIRQWGFGTTPHQWMVYKLPDQNLNELPDDMPQYLLCLASLLERCKKQPSLWMRNLQTIYGQKLTKWYPELIQCGYKLPSSQDEQNNPVFVGKTQSQPDQLQLRIEQSEICLMCPFRKQSNITPSIESI